MASWSVAVACLGGVLVLWPWLAPRPANPLPAAFQPDADGFAAITASLRAQDAAGIAGDVAGWRQQVTQAHAADVARRAQAAGREFDGAALRDYARRDAGFAELCEQSFVQGQAAGDRAVIAVGARLWQDRAQPGLLLIGMVWDGTRFLLDAITPVAELTPRDHKAVALRLSRELHVDSSH